MKKKKGKKIPPPIMLNKDIYQTFKVMFPTLKPVMWWKNKNPGTIRIRLDCGIGKNMDIFFNYVTDTCWTIKSV